jgi:hypothetical protein
VIHPGDVLRVPQVDPNAPTISNIWDGWRNGLEKGAEDTIDQGFRRAVDASAKHQGIANPATGEISESLVLFGANGKRITANECIDRKLTAHKWKLNETLGRPHGGVYLTPEGVNAIFALVERQNLINEGMWDSVKQFTKGAKKNAKSAWKTVKPYAKTAGKYLGKASDYAEKGLAGINKAVGQGWDAASNKISAPYLNVQWKMKGKVGADGSINSDDVVEFLKGQGVTDYLIGMVFKQLNLPMTGDNQEQPQQNQVNSIFADPAKLQAEFEKAGSTIPMSVRAELGDILKTAFSTVRENRRVRA